MSDLHPSFQPSEKDYPSQISSKVGERELGRRVSEAVYWKDYYEYPDVSYEWNNGLLEEKPMPDYLSVQLYTWFFELLREYLKSFPS